MWMKDYVNLENSRVDYHDGNHKMKWLNIITSNSENNIKTSTRAYARGTFRCFWLSRSTGSTTDIQEDIS